MDLMGVRPETLAEAQEMLRDLDVALSFGSSWIGDNGVLEVRAVKGTRYTVYLIDAERAELRWIEHARGLRKVAGWHDPGAGLALPPNMARKAWEMAQLKLAA